MLAESAGRDDEYVELETLRHAVCSPEFCAASAVVEGRRWHVLASRSDRLVPAAELARACAEADIVVSDRRLPAVCRPRWLKADRALLARTGGLAVILGREPRVLTVAATAGRHPWAGSSR